MQLIPRFGLNGPAAIDHDGICQKIYINPLDWIFLRPEEKRFIIAHELAHCEYDLYDEQMADEIGLSDFMASGGRPEAALSAMQKTLNPRYRSHRARMENMTSHIRYPRFRRSYFGPLSDEEENPDTSNWDADDWLAFINAVGNAGPDWIRAFMGQPDPETTAPSPPEEEGLSATHLLLILGGFMLLVFIFLISRST